MFSPNTVIVIGAAASMNFGFPLGKNLRADILKKLELDFDDDDIAVLNKAAKRIYGGDTYTLKRDHELAEAGLSITRGLTFASSIDHFLDMRSAESKLVQLGKRAIAQIIADREAACTKLHLSEFGRERNVYRFDDTWLQTFAEICFEDVKCNRIPEALQAVSIISFNYDRCVEQFVRLAITGLYPVPFYDACTLADKHFQVLYPYGSIGKLLPVSGDYSDGHAFGEDGVPPLSAMAKRIRLFTEPADHSNDERQEIKATMQAAKRVIFLGFGYHRQNIELLRFPESNVSLHRVTGTAYGLSQQSQKITKERLCKAFGIGIDIIHLQDQKCEELMDSERQALINSQT